MAKKKQVSSPPTPEEQHKNWLKTLMDSIKHIPEPTYFFNVGDQVLVGNLQEVIISDILENGKIYEVDYTNVESNYGNPISTPHCKNYFTWTSIRKRHSNAESFSYRDDIRISYSNTTLESLLHRVYSFGVDFEPSYQRDYVWELSDKISLIDSIYHNIEIGKFAFIRRDTDSWIKTGCRYEILDGKQRLRAICDFFEDRFSYRGRVFSDLSRRDQNHFRDFICNVGEVDCMTPEKILQYFLKLNTCGKVMSKEHLDKVRALLDVK